MEIQEIINLLNDSSNEEFKFATKNGMLIDQPSQLGKKFDSKFLPSIFASLKAFRWQKFSCLFLLAVRVHE